MANTDETSTAQTSLREPLLSPGLELTKQDDLTQKVKNGSLLIGMCCGILVQLSTLGANFLLLTFCPEETIAKQSDGETLFFSLFWSLLTSSLALVVLALLRRLIKSTLDFTASGNGHECEEKTRERGSLMMAVEIRFVVGALVGVCFAWTCADFLLGMHSLAMYSLCFLFFAIVWSKAIIWYFSATDTTKSSRTISEKVVFIV